MNNLVALFCGVLFAIGLSVSGMVDPNKVIGFLDLLGEWDPSLAFVMAGAVIFNFLSFKFIFKKNKPLFSEKFHLPTLKDIDKRLVFGSVLFGVGWGLSGICPGPGIVNLVTLDEKALLFVAAMVVGMGSFKVFGKFVK